MSDSRTIKIRLKSGKRIRAPKAIRTSHPLLFITPQILKPEASPTKRAQFNTDFWAITHVPTGYAIAHTETVEEGRRFADILGESAIPWKSLRSKRDARKYDDDFRRARKKFYKTLEASYV